LTTYSWAIDDNVTNLGSVFCQHQCGDWANAPGSTCSAPIGNGGFIDCEALAGTIARHEAATDQTSHWTNYAFAVFDPSNNISATAEQVIGGKDLSQQVFEDMVDGALMSPRLALIRVTAQEPIPCTMCAAGCGPPLGNINCTNPNTGAWIRESCVLPEALLPQASELPRPMSHK